MSLAEAPPRDHAPAVRSLNFQDFVDPSNREEEWKFTPLERITGLLEPIGTASGIGWASTSPYVSEVAIDDPRLHDSWTPTDRVGAVARGAVEKAILIDVPKDILVDGSIIVDLKALAAVNYAHIEVVVGEFSSATVVIRHDVSADVVGNLVVQAGAESDVKVLSVLDGDATGRQLWQWHTIVGRNATSFGLSIALGGEVVRMVPSVEYSAPGGSAVMLGAFLADGSQYQEHRLFVDHAQPNCTSYVAYKGALAGGTAHTVWVGDVLVRRAATGIETYEMNRNLLLADGPRADSVPNLELETGDVVGAGHASATGRFDDEQLFYLQSRGIPERVARQLVVRGFFADVLSKISDEGLRREILGRIEQRLGMESTSEVEDGGLDV
jgi:Fe-S cluster assembly protein SufD